MVKCKCVGGGVCSCVVQAGTNVTITGAGSLNNPWIISSTAVAKTYVAGAGLTESPAGTHNVGQGTGVVVSADTVAVDVAWGDARWGGAAATPTVPGAGLTEAPAGTLNVGQGIGIIVNPNDVAADTAYLGTIFSPTTHTHPAPVVPTEVLVGGAAPITGTIDQQWSNTSGLTGSATPGATSPLAPTFVRDGGTGTYFRSSPALIDDLKDVDTSTVKPIGGHALCWNGPQIWDGTGQWVPAIRLREIISANPPVGYRQLRWVQPS